MESSILYFDTLYHSKEDSYTDIIQFKVPVRITEIRVVPSGSIIRVGYLLREGSTKPSESGLDFYAREVERPEAATFADLGGFDYSEKRSVTTFQPEKSVLTDFLVIKGTFKCLTIAIFGVAAGNLPTNIQNQPSLQNLMPLRQNESSGNMLIPTLGGFGGGPGGDAVQSNDFGGSRMYAAPRSQSYPGGSNMQPGLNYVKRAFDPSLGDEIPRQQPLVPIMEVDELCGSADAAFDDIASRVSGLEEISSLDNFAVYGPQDSVNLTSSLSQVDSSAKLTSRPSISEENRPSVSSWLEKADDLPQSQQEEIEYAYDSLSYYQQEHEQLTAIVAAAAVAQQGVGEHQLSGLENFVNPSSTVFETAVAVFLREQAKGNSGQQPPIEAQKLLTLIEDLLTSGEDTSHPREGMVKTLEQASNILAKGLAYWYVFSEETFTDLLDSLCEWAITAADYGKAVKLIESSPLFKIRALKAGLNLLCELVLLSPACALRVLHDGRIQQHLVEILTANQHKRDDEMTGNNDDDIAHVLTSPLENLVIRTLFYTCVFEQGAAAFVDHKREDSNYAKFLSWLVEEKRRNGSGGKRRCVQRRCFEPALSLLKSISAYEVAKFWHSLITKLGKALQENENCSSLIDQICECYEWFTAQWKEVAASPASLDHDARLISFCRHSKSMKLLDVILVLLSEPASHVLTRDQKRHVINVVSEFLNALSASKSGLLFMLCDGTITNQLIRELVMTSGRLQQTAIDLSYRLLMLQLLDQLVASNVTKDEHRLVVLRTLASLVGRQHCVHLLAEVLASDSKHIDILLKIVEASMPQVSVEVEYILMLLLALVGYQPLTNAQLADRIVNLCKQCGENCSLATELKSMIPFFEEQDSKLKENDNPFEIRKVCLLLKQFAQPLAFNHTRVLSSGLTAILRVILYAIRFEGQESFDRLIAISALWNYDVLSIALQILRSASHVRLTCVQRNCYPGPAQHQMLYSIVDICIKVISAMVTGLAPTGITLVEVEPFVQAVLEVHAAFCALPPSSSSFSLNESMKVHEDLLSLLHEIFLLPVKITLASRPPLQFKLIAEIIKQSLSSPSLHLSGLILLADMLAPSTMTEHHDAVLLSVGSKGLTRIETIRQTFAATFFIASGAPSSCDLTRLLTSLYITDSPPLQAVLFRFLRALASISKVTATNVLRLTLSLTLDNLAKVASSLRNVEPLSVTGGNNTISESPDSAQSLAGEFGDFVSSPFYAACKALAVVTHLMATSPASQAVVISELAAQSTDKASQPFRQIIPDLATLLAGCCRRLAKLSPLQAGEFMMHALDFFTQLISPNLLNKGGITRFIPMSTLILITETSFRCLTGPKSTLSNATGNLNSELFNDGTISPDMLLAGQTSSSMPPGVQQAAWRLIAILAEERDAAAVWAVTDAHPGCLNQAVMEACEPIASGSTTLDEDAIATLSEMSVALSMLASRNGCGQRMQSLICHGSSDATNPIEQLHQQLSVLDFYSGEEDGSALKERIDASGLTERLQQLIETMKRPTSSAALESVPASEELDINRLIDQVFAEIPLDLFAAELPEDATEDAIRFWWLVPESVHDASCTVETSQRVRIDLETTLRRYRDNVDLANDVSLATAAIIDPVTSMGRLGMSGEASVQRAQTINTSRTARKYVAPMRGRGWLGPPSGSGHRAPPVSMATLGMVDIRGRAPNTSRPPSMHVDDFQKMERSNPPGSAGALGGAGFRGSSYRGRGFRGGFRGGLSGVRSSLLPSPGFDRDSSVSKSAIDELIALASDPVVMAASAISSGNNDMSSSMAAFPFLNSVAQQSNSSQADAASALPPFPLPIPLQMLPLLPPEELQKLAASMFEVSHDGNNNNDDSSRRSPSRRRQRERSGSHDSDYDRHRSSSRRN